MDKVWASPLFSLQPREDNKWRELKEPPCDLLLDEGTDTKLGPCQQEPALAG